ncbi:hypothetical protein COCSUDRAFT_32297 [Coccomyxa subellipsoidea C-169]|uniref:Uncharacterized protein n=1 Tax=Coccomyxa subellipsoidea (strain C-169) TaxID=574566 RepID=I0Z8A7_COCSC|nr:hypothetical protein COCSUDRAFT_32297 [Coccomyxa subellipsoidea C-169]EIE26876.1 hypothetical protein COCSUDRAFT_32297 [Coccomyxa subellipsoidea C-169]|eukprot:XP_005651420.1 hypothetical protein COCSUDRAFT_32297 [Coccomyxa subellipsoidea C-169]
MTPTPLTLSIHTRSKLGFAAANTHRLTDTVSGCFTNKPFLISETHNLPGKRGPNLAMRVKTPHLQDPDSVRPCMSKMSWNGKQISRSNTWHPKQISSSMNGGA